MLSKILVFAVFTLLATACTTNPWQPTSAPPQRSDGLATAPANQLATNTEALVNLVVAGEQGNWGSVDSLLIMKDNHLIVERYFRGNQWNQPHELRSLTKSLLSAGYGAAISHGLITGVNLPVYDVFDQVGRFTHPHPDKRLITFAHVMTMTAGLDCGVMSSASNSCDSKLFNLSVSSKSSLQTPPWRRALGLPLVDKPGTRFVYNDAAPVIVDAMLSGSTHQKTNEFMQLVLFKPMQFYERSSLSRLTSRDLIKFGQLYLHGGVWNSKRLLLKRWVEESTSIQWQFADTTAESGYGYFWWISGIEINGKREKIFYGLGNGGQAVFVVPTLKLVFVTTATNYDRYEMMRAPLDMLKQYVIPAFVTSAAAMP